MLKREIHSSRLCVNSSADSKLYLELQRPRRAQQPTSESWRLGCLAEEALRKEGHREGGNWYVVREQSNGTGCRVRDRVHTWANIPSYQFTSMEKRKYFQQLMLKQDIGIERKKLTSCHTPDTNILDRRNIEAKTRKLMEENRKTPLHPGEWKVPLKYTEVLFLKGKYWRIGTSSNLKTSAH